MQLFEEPQVPKETWGMEDDFHASRAMPGLAGMDSFPFVFDWLTDTLTHGRPAGTVE